MLSLWNQDKHEVDVHLNKVLYKKWHKNEKGNLVWPTIVVRLGIPLSSIGSSPIVHILSKS